jgi:phenylacetyl-CoA:acceptor oxidoreductase subunit 1
MTDMQTRTPRWGMVIDLNRCVGCQTCTIACKHANDTPPGVQWRRVIDVEQGTFPDVQRQFMVVGCQHCAEPPCVPVCPTGATKQRADGLVTQDYDICIGCAYCAVACPYQARTIVHDMEGYYGDGLTRQEAAVGHADRLGVAQKCTFCKERVDDGLAAGLTPGVDPAATPACSAACIASAIKFGDFNDADSEVSRLVRDNPVFQMHEELGTDPQIKYLYTTPAVPGREPEAADLDDAHLSDPASPLVGQRQTLWDWRAAMNWMFGGVGSGFVFWCWLLYLGGHVSPDLLAWLNLAGGGLMGVGLFFVFLKIGRKLRFWRAIMRPQTSWMSRELYVVGLFGIGVLAGLFWRDPLPFAIAGLGAIVFVACQAMILFKGRGIPAWRRPIVPWMIVATGLFEGLGLLAIVTGLWLLSPSLVPPQTAREIVNGFILPNWFVVAIILFGTANVVLWLTYHLRARKAGVGPLARRVIARVTLPLIAVGHAGAVVLVLLGLYLPAGNAVVFLLGGLAAIAGGAFWKFTVITRAAYQQGFAMPKQPHRGSGARAAPPRLDGTAIRPEGMIGAGAA